MKTMTLIMVCLLLGFGLTQLSAQNSESEYNHSYSEWVEVAGWFPAYCNGVMVENLYGTVRVHIITKMENGTWKFQISQWKGEIKSETGEVFQCMEVDKSIKNEGMRVTTCHGNLRGDKGSHYIIFYTVYYNPRTVIVDKAVCPGNDIE